MLTIKVDCRTCPTSNSVDVHPDDYRNYLYNNQLVQNVWPDLSPSQREIIWGIQIIFICVMFAGTAWEMNNVWILK